jgi:site-specific DNA recombinase
VLPVVLDNPNEGRGPARQTRPPHAPPLPLLRRSVLAMTAAVVLVIAVAVLTALGSGAIALVRWARRTGQRPWLLVLGAYVAANIPWGDRSPTRHTGIEEIRMIAAVYARKSTEQNGIGDEEKFVARQIEHAKAYAAKKGWTVDDAHVYSDDGISGAEFKKRPGFLRLLNALSPRPPFQVLVMSEESRLGREAIETGYVLKHIMDAGVRVFFYLEDRERTLDTAMDKVMLSLTNFASEMEREKARQRTYDAMVRKAKALHVTGGKVYGYDNVDVPSPENNGTRLRVIRQINQQQAATIRRVFELYASGVGMTKIAHRLNQEGVKPPRGRGWAPSGIREMLHRELYRGVVDWNRSQKIVRAGTKKQRRRDEAEWLRIDAPELRHDVLR